MPLKTCIRSNEINYKNNMFYLSKWVEDDNINSKDLKIKYYLSKIATLHKKSSYTLNVTSSFYNEISYKIEELIHMPLYHSLNIIRGKEKAITTFISKLPKGF